MSNFRRKSRNNKKRSSNRRNSQRRAPSCPKPRRNQRNSRRRNQRNSRRRNQRNSRRRNQRNSRRRNRRNSRRQLRGGAIPFSELGLAYDNLKYGMNSALAPFQDQNSGVPNNPTTDNVNPNPTSQFLSSRAVDDAILGPDLQTIHTNHFA